MGAEDFVKLSFRYRADFAAAGASIHAELLFIRSMAHCGLLNSHGLIARPDLPGLTERLPRPAAVVDELVTYGFWQSMPNGWRITNWDKWQAELEAVQAKRERDAERKRAERSIARRLAMEET